MEIKDLSYVALSFVSLCSLPFVALAQSSSESVGPVSIQFILNGKRAAFPPGVQDALLKLTSAELKNSVVLALGQTGFYRNIFLEEAQDADGHVLWKVSAESQKRITEVIFTGVTASEESDLRRSLRTQASSAFNEQDIASDLQRIPQKLAEKGFLRSEVIELPARSVSFSEVSVGFQVSKGRPCIIAEVITIPQNNFFDFLTSIIEPGSLCDKAAVLDALEKERNRLRGEGYLDSDLVFEGFTYTADKERATLKLKVGQGKRTRIIVENSVTGGFIEDLFQGRSNKFSASEVAFLSDDEIQREILLDIQSKGYPRALVTGPQRIVTSSETVLKFVVQPGIQVVIGEVNFEGKIPFSRKELVEKLDMAPGIFQKKTPYVESDLPKIRTKIENVFVESGYDEVAVSEPAVNMSIDGRTAELTFQIEPGREFVVQQITKSGMPEGFKPDEAALKKEMAPGSPISRRVQQGYTKELQLQLIQQGYAYAAEPTVKIEFLQPEAGTVPTNVAVVVVPGPSVKIGRILAEGDLFGKGERIVSESGLNSGDDFLPKKFDDARQRLLQHGLFANVEIRPLSKASFENREPVLDILIKVQKRPSYNLSLGPGWGTLEGYRFGVDYSKNNLTQAGLQFILNASVSQRKDQPSHQDDRQLLGRKISLGIVEPLFSIGNLVTPLDASLAAGWSAEVRPLNNKAVRTIQSELVWRPYFLDTAWTLRGKLAHEISEVLGNKNQISIVEAIDQAAIQINEVILSVALDTRNARDWPTSGGYFEVASNTARFGFLASQAQYDRLSVDTNIYVPLSNRFTAAVSAGGLTVFNAKNRGGSNQESVIIPSSRRAFIVGKSQVRGFREDDVSLGPLLWRKFEKPANFNGDCSSTLDGIGATKMAYFKGETRFRSPWLDNSLGFVGFVDSALAFLTSDELSEIQDRFSSSEKEIDRRIAGAENPEAAASDIYGGVEKCRLVRSRVVGNTSANLNNYFRNSYVGAGFGMRIILQNFGFFSLDLGFPISEPATRSSGCFRENQRDGVDFTNQSENTSNNSCIYRSNRAKMLGLIPGVIHINIGSNF